MIEPPKVTEDPAILPTSKARVQRAKGCELAEVFVIPLFGVSSALQAPVYVQVLSRLTDLTLEMDRFTPSLSRHLVKFHSFGENSRSW